MERSANLVLQSPLVDVIPQEIRGIFWDENALDVLINTVPVGYLDAMATRSHVEDTLETGRWHLTELEQKQLARGYTLLCQADPDFQRKSHQLGFASARSLNHIKAGEEIGARHAILREVYDREPHLDIDRYLTDKYLASITTDAPVKGEYKAEMRQAVGRALRLENTIETGEWHLQYEDVRQLVRCTDWMRQHNVLMGIDLEMSPDYVQLFGGLVRQAPISREAHDFLQDLAACTKTLSVGELSEELEYRYVEDVYEVTEVDEGVEDDELEHDPVDYDGVSELEADEAEYEDDPTNYENDPALGGILPIWQRNPDWHAAGIGTFALDPTFLNECLPRPDGSPSRAYVSLYSDQPMTYGEVLGAYLANLPAENIATAHGLPTGVVHEAVEQLERIIIHGSRAPVTWDIMRHASIIPRTTGAQPDEYAS